MDYYVLRASNKINFGALKIPPFLPFPKGGIPLFGKEG
jgi:hypothetical protein